MHDYDVFLDALCTDGLREWRISNAALEAASIAGFLIVGGAPAAERRTGSDLKVNLHFLGLESLKVLVFLFFLFFY